MFTTSPPTAAVFDFDGLIARTESCWHDAYRSVLARRDRTLTAADIAALAGASVRAAADGLEIPADELRRELSQAFATAEISALPGVEGLVEQLGSFLPLAVATNGPRRLVLGALRRLGLEPAFAHVISAEDLAREKPAPDVYLEACRALAADPATAVAFEDSAIGVTAARRAGMFVVQVTDDPGQRADADLRVPRIDDPALLSLLGLESRR